LNKKVIAKDGWEVGLNSNIDHNTYGKHLMVDVWGVNFDLINDLNLLSKLIQNIVVDAKMSLINLSMKQFNPQGVTVLGLLEESHISVHTYPEHGYAAFDIFTCGSEDPFRHSINWISKVLQPTFIDYYYVQRGVPFKKMFELKQIKHADE
jgi:S-adenosylmethionine decarboxylase